MRRLCRGLAVSLPIFILLLGVLLIGSKPVFAQATTGATKIGTHLIQGDESLQKKVLAKLRENGLGTGNYPVVVMIYPDGSGLSALTDATNGFKPIARLNITCENGSSTDPSQLAQLASQIPAGVPIVVGNEINNQNAANGEWKCSGYSQYAAIVNAVCSRVNGKNPCGIAALDTINGDYDLLHEGGKVRQDILNDIVGGIVRSNITAVFANVYQTGGCGSYTADRCTTQSGQWIINQLHSRGFSASDLYITEFGITTCGDYDCIQEFYEKNNDLPAVEKVGFTRPPGDSTSSTWVHTVPAVCQYWEGAGLTVKRPSKCGGGADRPVFVYPGIEDMSPDESKMKQMAAGYQLMCGNQFHVQGELQGSFPPDANINCDGPNPNRACIVPGVFANIILDDTKAVIPLFRLEGAQVPNPDGPKRRLDDLEGFFGANYTKNPQTGTQAISSNTVFLPPLANGVSRKVSGNNSLCQLTIEYLNAIKNLCDTESNRNGYTFNDKLDADAMKSTAPPTPRPTLPPGECALYSKIPGANANYDTYKKIIDGKPSSFSCYNIDKPTLDSTWYREFSKIELTTSKGFKPAYLVHYIDRPEVSVTSLDKRVNWNSPNDTSSDPNDPLNISDRIKIVKVYIPAGFAEVSIPTENLNPYLEEKDKQPSFFPTYTGGFMQTIQSRLSLQNQAIVLHTRASEIVQLLQKMSSGTIFDIGDSGIKCTACKSRAAADPLDPRMTIIRRINAGILQSNNACSSDRLIGETANERVHTINPAGTLDPVKPAKITASATMMYGRPDTPPETIKTFLLLPEEFRNITDYERQLLYTFVPKENQNNKEFQFATTVDQKQAYPAGAFRYLQLTGSTVHIDGGSVDGPTIQYDKAGTIDPLTGLPYKDTFHLTGKISTSPSQSEINTNAQIPGGILARTVWEIMCNVTRPFDNINTIPYPGFESFLKGSLSACTKGAKPNGTTPSTIAEDGFCKGTTTIPADLQDPTLAKLHAYVNSVEQDKGIPTNLLWGIINIEGSPALRAMRNGQTSLTCGPPDQYGSAGPLQLQSSQCGGFGTWEQNSAGVTGGNCGLTSSIQVAGNLLVRLSKYGSVIAKPDRWYRAAGMYNGLCLSDEQANAGAPSCKTLDLRNSNKCDGAPAVQGCLGNNYCVCAKDGFN